ncbi:ChaN family lipoprotein [Sphingobacterium sp. DR205]|uniref:ChaN family lipoprotein n=1 Tax=Sphingobacterium sp. DR205 TaxID=2713573 RepID=UPI0013E4C1FA|nr:ChaN family lipoprotein [Sphingobacterium sp. DR205]QIH35636.1 ChaN family lipoprotein [Sphingobacterium sp. DR205]
MMNYLFTILSFLYLNVLQAQESNKTQLYIIGTVHDSSAILNPEMLFEILDNIRPEILLQENDSAQIKDFARVIRPNSNEQTATLKYLEQYPKTRNLPFEFEGRNQYRKDKGMVPADRLVIQLIDSLYKTDKLSIVNKSNYQKYSEANSALINFSKTDIKTLNSIVFEALNRYRQDLQHHEIPKISNSEPIFAERYITKPNGQKISYREGYQLWCNFWDLRNNTMAINIIKQANIHRGKRIVVLTGAQHKYYLKELLAKYNDGSYQVIEYFK